MKNKTGHNRTIWLISAIALMVALSSAACCMSWSSFEDAVFTGITASPAFASNILTYNLSLDSNPTMTFNGNTYDVVWVQGFYALSKDGVSTFYAGGDDIGDWGWNTFKNISSPNDYYVAGWSCVGEISRIDPGDNMDFTYTAFEIPDDTEIILGLHVGYYNTGEMQNVTAFFKTEDEEPPIVPEIPASVLFGLGAPIAALAATARRKLA